MNFYALHPRLFIRPHTRHIDTERVLAALAERQIQMVVNVALINDPILAGGCRTVGIEYRHVPLHDSGNKMDRFLVRTIAKDVASRLPYHAVLVHCDSGWNRSALIGVLALMYHTGQSPKDLIIVAREARGHQLLKNKAFEQFLLEEVP